MDLLKVDTIPEARSKMLAHLEKKPLAVTSLPWEEAIGRIIARDLCAPEDIPAFARSTVDGYAVLAADTAGAGESIPVQLTIAGRVEMGAKTDLQLHSGLCAYIPTGGMLPQGANAVVMTEYCEIFGDSNLVIFNPVAPGENTVSPGDDAQNGALLIPRGRLCQTREIALLAAAGLTRVPTYTPLNMAIISTGDELVPATAQPRPGEVRDINTPALSALARATGYTVGQAAVVRDEEEILLSTVRDMMTAHDIVIVSGGSSQGEKDATARIFSQIADEGVFTHGLAVKPGKPTILAFDNASGTLLVGLPGHPLSALLVFELLLTWLWQELTGAEPEPPLPAVLSQNSPGSPGKDTLLLVTLKIEQGVYTATPVRTRSGLVRALAASDGYVLIERNREGLRQGAPVLVQRFAPGF